MLNRETDREWEKFGRDDPYYGVITHDRYRRPKLTERVKEDFFASGREHVAHVLNTIRETVDSEFSIRRALDFGCGVGRLTMPLAGVAETVTGVDVSDSMLAEARNNCGLRGIPNATFVKSDDELSLVTGQFDFVHSYIVFQHIPVSRGRRIFARLLERLDDGGVGVVHFTYARRNVWRTVASLLKSYLPFASNIASVAKRRSFFAPILQMNAYDLNGLLSMVQGVRVQGFHAEFTDHGGDLGITVYFKKPAKVPL